MKKQPSKRFYFFIALLIFIVAVGIFSFWNSTIIGFIGGDDAYYHATHSALIAQYDQPSYVGAWAPYHFLTYAPVNPYFLHHYLSSFVIDIFGKTNGMKIVGIIQAALIFPLFFLVIKKKSSSIGLPLMLTVLFFFASPVLLARLLLLRPFVLSMSLAILSYVLMEKKRWGLLFFLSAAYILIYNLAPLTIGIALLFVLEDWLKKRPVSLAPLIATMGGMTLGLLLHPQTLNYINLIYTHFVQIFFLKLSGVVLPSGREIQPQRISAFFFLNIIQICASILTTALYLAFRKNLKTKEHHTALFILVIGWFVVSFFIPRAVEYWVPFVWLLIALLLNDASIHREIREMKRVLSLKLFLPIVEGALAIGLVFLGTANMFLIKDVIDQHNQSEDTASYAEAAAYLQSHTPEGSILFYPIWSMFPKLFFFNTHNRYVTAFDPVFLYKYQPDLYWIWYNMVYFGRYCDQKDPCTTLGGRQNIHAIHLAFQYLFHTDTIVVPKHVDGKSFADRTLLGKILEVQKDQYTNVYENADLIIYSVNPQNKNRP
ncbi:MAG TPA: hypothetical protein DCY48_01755 [Candidatus Magasanikbacteria bacterium]|nr:MAG: hypothetical protein A3I74_00665 [Candidatus Magasanikbacteria bacterium RIFCSPLOWO2_02_FULL_47_16]OGH80038.1 MAG: hypothetical protein A3C10_02560 [Candidatus Magasanikbacteria bacterium RIFCSPHIGHO2_02_FULL_48_18]OGH81854.1 MAG: hypothetical protein A3G08_03095 [Candidatus Magasanikbacteria bacterium RIFCSPLOWO2_12_FULL_47_9b]HAZ28481.1 hypothetical protein [Candidatus Magasanikbacteria bacterium]